jgi:DNA-binding transcriptional ArsR family regulator
MPIDLELTPRQERYKLLRFALHELRCEMRLAVLDAYADGETTPTDLARRGGISLATVAYHVRTMAKEGLLELVSERPVRGAVEHTYKLSDRGRQLWRDLGLKETHDQA